MSGRNKYNFVGEKVAAKKYDVGTYVRRSYITSIIGLIIGITIVGMFAGLLGGGIKTTNTMDAMQRGMQFMVNTMRAPSDYVQQMMTTFPDDQLQKTTKQVFSTAGNLQQISERVNFLLNNVEPNQVFQVLKHVDGITSRAEKLMNGVTEDEAALIKGHFMGILEQAHNLVSGVSKEQVAQTVNNVNRVMSELDVNKLNELVQNTGAIEQRLKDLHEIKIQI